MCVYTQCISDFGKNKEERLSKMYNFKSKYSKNNQNISFYWYAKKKTKRKSRKNLNKDSYFE